MLRLVHDRVLVKRISTPTQTKGGIYLPLVATELPQLGHITHLGTNNPNELSVGDLVLVKKFEGARLWVIGEELWAFRQEDLLAIITD